jgi:cardiolipin synthase A/B
MNAASSSPATPQPEPKLTFVDGGTVFFEHLHRVIAEAATELHLQTYIFDPDDTGRAVVEALVAAAQRQVKVTVLIDAYGSAALPKTVEDELASAGIKIRRFAPWFSWQSLHLGRRLHHKVVVADGKVSLIGGINIANKYRGTAADRAWLDYAVRIESTIVGQELSKLCQAHFDKKFSYSRKRIRDGADGNRVTILINDWLLGKNEIQSAYRSAIRLAKQKLTIVGTYFLPGRMMSYSLRKAAQRGVEIKLILSGTSDVPIVQRATQYLYNRLLRHGLRLFEWPHSVLHGKAAIIDGRWTTIGSFNLNALSAYGSIEMNVGVESAAFAEASSQAFEAAIAECTEITSANLQTRQGWHQRLLNWICYHLVSTGFSLLTFTAYRRLWRPRKERQVERMSQ